MRDGDVLVCPITSPAWAPIFPKVKGVVTDIGGVMSHAAIVCREYGLPAVVGTGRATAQIQHRPDDPGRRLDRRRHDPRRVMLVPARWRSCGATTPRSSAARARTSASCSPPGSPCRPGSRSARRHTGRSSDATGIDGTIAAGPYARRRGRCEGDRRGDALRAVPDDLRGELDLRYAELGEPPVAVRSSALGEDSQDATYAGQQETLPLGARSRRSSATRCASAGRACTRRGRSPTARKLGATDAAMGVTVQTMVDAEVSGVMFTCNPVSGDPSMVAVNASWGLGLAVVGGETNPDDYLVSKVTGEIVRRTINSKESSTWSTPSGRGTVRVEVPAERRERPCLDDERARRARRRSRSASSATSAPTRTSSGRSSAEHGRPAHPPGAARDRDEDARRRSPARRSRS